MKINQIEYEESDIEKLRKYNIERNEAELRRLFPENYLDGLKESIRIKKQNRTTQTSRTKVDVPVIPRSSLRRACKRKYDDDSENEDDVCGSDDEYAGQAVIKFKWNKVSPIRTPKRKVFVLRPFDAVKEEDLVLVAERTSDKRYDSIDGSTCHQCRQKTDDLKTVCRSGYCFGVRGQFCGPCLKNRYGECAKDAILNPDWQCPPCRGICNCSFCMKKRGKRATGILIHLAKIKGFSDVKSYLGD